MVVADNTTGDGALINKAKKPDNNLDRASIINDYTLFTLIPIDLAVPVTDFMAASSEPSFMSLILSSAILILRRSSSRTGFPSKS